MASVSRPSDHAPRLVKKGSALFVAAGRRPLGRVGVRVEVVTGPPVEILGWRRIGTAWVGEGGGLRCSLTEEAVFPGLLLSADLVNDGADVLALRRFRLEVQCEAGIWDEAQGAVCGLKIAYCGAHSRSAHSRSGVVELNGAGRERSWWVGALAPQRGGPGIVLGGADFRRFATAVDLAAAGLEAAVFLERWRLAPGERLRVAPLWLGVSPDVPFALLEAYAANVGARHGVTPREPPCGWGSWGHFLESIDADLMRENLRALDASPALRDALRVVQIDDGWSELLETERASASWRPNRRFPSGIAPLADAVRRGGRHCGLWLLPFTVNEGSPLAVAHPGYLVRDETGQPKRVAGGASFCLDPTHPGAHDWLVDLSQRLCDWSVSYVKLDHLRALLMPDPDVADDDLDAPRVHWEPVTRVEAFRRGLASVRQVMGPETFVVGCSAPGGPSVGLVDAHRIGPDIEPAWEGRHSGIRDAAKALAANFFWQGRTWINDPDYLLASGSIEESRFWATAVALSGGSAIVSADLPELPPWQEELFAAVTPPTGRAARPLDLFEHAEGPRLWHLAPEAGRDGWHAVGLFNWGDRPAEMPLDLIGLGFRGPVHVWDVWRGCHRMARGREMVFVEARTAALLNLRPAAARPQVVGTNVHFAPDAWVFSPGGEAWQPRSRTLRLLVRDRLPRSGSAYLWVPEPWRLAPGARAGARGNLVEVPLRPGGAIEVPFTVAARRRGGKGAR